MNEPKDEIRLEQLGDRFVDAWVNSRHGEEVNIDSFLPPAGDPFRADGIRFLVPIDLEHRIGRGENVLLEAYVDRYPELGPLNELPVGLIHNELQIRQRHDHRVQLESYRDRFPTQFEALADLDRLSQTKKMSGTLRPPKLTTIETSSSVPKLPVIQTDEGYKLKKRLGRGQFGEVWSAEAPGGVEVAVKIISFPIEHEMTQLELKSLEVMKRLRHAFLLQVQAYWFDDDRLFIVMELGDETLQDLGERHAKSGQPIPLPKLLGYFREASDAVDFLHRENVLHRDIKPANILLASGHVKVADFGISRVLGDRGLTVTATTMGTPLYMAPEVWNGRASARSDQYSLAMTYAELRMGRPPYSSTSLAAVMNDHLKSLPNLDLLDAAERKVIGKALAKDADDRFESCTDFSNALQEALLPRASTRKQERSRFPIVAMSAIMAIVLLIVATAIWWLRPPQPLYQTLVAIPGCKPLDVADFAAVNGRRYAREIVWESPLGAQAEFILIPNEGPDDPATFYMSKYKITNRLFGEFAASDAGKELNPFTEWELGGQARIGRDGTVFDHETDLGVENYPDYPVFRVHIEDAERFAKWLGGNRGRLPSARQWDKAAGRDRWQFEGPFDRPFADIVNKSTTEVLVAFDRVDEGPLPVGTAIADISRFGCRDMAGNGMEWTRTSAINETHSSVLDFQGEDVMLRGGPYRRGLPHTFEVENPEEYDFVNPEISFRVVLEVTTGSTPE